MNVSPTAPPPTAGTCTHRNCTGDPQWGEECPLRITKGDGGENSTRVSTHCELPTEISNLVSTFEVRDYRLTVPALDTPMLAIFEIVKFAYQVEYKLHFRGFGEVFGRYLRTKCMQTHYQGRQLPVLAVHTEPNQLSVQRFVQGAWYTCTDGDHPVDSHQVIQVIRVMETHRGTVAFCRRVFQELTKEGVELHGLDIMIKSYGILNEEDLDIINKIEQENDKPLHKYCVGAEFQARMIKRCACCTPACPEAIHLPFARAIFCPRKRLFGHGRVFEPTEPLY